VSRDTPTGDTETARAFSESWNRVGEGSVYSEEQFLEWFEPLDPAELEGKDVLELGFGNGSLLYHVGQRKPRRLAGVELGDTLEQTRRNLVGLREGMLELHRGDLCKIDLGQFDVVYCIGVLHHLEDPQEGFRSVLRHVRPGGKFHCWVYAWEGNWIVRTLVEPLRRLGSRIPWWLTKYGLALPLAIPFFLYSKFVAGVSGIGGQLRRLPLFEYSCWIAPRPFAFFRHVAFDQLVTPRTAYVDRQTLEKWLMNERVDPGSRYLIFRNGNSWKFGGRVRSEIPSPEGEVPGERRVRA